MAAYDNVSLAAPPNIATAGNYAQMLMQGLSQLGKDYQSGQEFNYQQQQRNLFQSPDNQAVLQNAIQTGNYAPLLQKMIQSQGASAAPVIGQLMGDQSGASLAKMIAGGGSQPVNTAPAAAPSASGPANITGQTPTQTSETQGGDRINNLAADRGIDVDQFLGRYPGFRSLLNQDLTPGQAKAVTQRMDAMRGGGGTSPQPNPVPQSGLQDESNVNQQVPTGAAGGSGPISPAPTAASGNIGGAPSAGRQATPTFAERFAGSPSSTGGATPVQTVRPTPVGTESEARQALEKARQLRAISAAVANRNPKAAEQAGKAADYQEERAKQIFESIGKFNEPGRTQRDVESGATLKAEQIKTDTERYGKQYDAYQHQAEQAHQLLSTNSITKSLMDSPNFYSGSGADHVLTMQRFAVALGLKPQDYAMANEVFGKTVSSAILDQIRSLGGQGLGQVRVAEINVMKQAAQNRDNTPASNRMLTEMQDRMAKQWTIPIAEAAQRYNNGHLDAGFDRWKQDYINSHPLFSKEELADPRRIAPPLARTPADLAKIGWTDGMPFRTGRTLPDGRPEIFTHAPKGGPAPAAPAFNPNGA